MRIEAIEFVCGEGAKFKILADNAIEHTLLTACVDNDGSLFVVDDEIGYVLTLPVSN